MVGVVDIQPGDFGFDPQRVLRAYWSEMRLPAPWRVSEFTASLSGLQRLLNDELVTSNSKHFSSKQKFPAGVFFHSLG